MLIVHVAHRALIVRKLKGLEDIIPFTSVHWLLEEKGKTQIRISKHSSFLLTTARNRMAILHLF
jgi:glutathionyl-hydroquinone reductase